jgi:hypothetical protein
MCSLNLNYSLPSDIFPSELSSVNSFDTRFSAMPWLSLRGRCAGKKQAVFGCAALGLTAHTTCNFLFAKTFKVREK